MRKIALPAIVSISLFASLSVPAHALNSRTWISGAGVDQAGCGPIANPCRSLQYAHDQTSAGGEIDVKDSAGYGSLVIAKAITVVGDGSIAGVVAAPGADAITINAPSDAKVTLRGLTVDGLGGGRNGIVFNTGGALTIDKCNIMNFTADGDLAAFGIFLFPPQNSTPKIAILDTTVTNNRRTGIILTGPDGSFNKAATATVDINRVISTNNSTGIYLLAATGSKFSVSQSVTSQNTSGGIVVMGASVSSLDSNVVTNNAGNGIYVHGTTMLLGRSVITGNGTGVLVFSGTSLTYKNNQINGNTSDICPCGGVLNAVVSQ